MLATFQEQLHVGPLSKLLTQVVSQHLAAIISKSDPADAVRCKVRRLVRRTEVTHRLQYIAVQYSTVQYSTVQYSTVQCGAVQCSTLS
jgi:hypothetical protein